MTHLIPVETIEKKIFVIRGHKVMLDRDIAQLYEVATKVLNQAVRRNIERFPEDFMFSLTKLERNELVTNCDRFKTLKHSTSMPFAFTEQGVAMLSSVLNSKRAIMVNIQIMRTFARLKEMIISHKDLQRKIDDMEKKYDHQFKIIFDALRNLLEPGIPRRRRIGFQKE